MKLRETPVEVERSEDIIESMFGISENDSSHILNILRNKLYSDKVLAVIREYCANAQDAHTEAGKSDTPIKVNLPNQLDATFKVRDYGTGLSEEDIRNIYVMYGASTKRTSNKVIGALGLGCKAAFSYSNKFHVISWFNGEKKTYCAYIDESQCGKIALLAAETTTEPEGIEVQVPVKPSDFNDFAGTARELLPYFKPLPILIGATLEENAYWLTGVTKSNITFCVQSDTHQDNSHIIMGGIPYPISTTGIDLGDWNSNRRTFLNLNIDFYVPIGYFDITANREDLEYTEDTITALSAMIDDAAAEAIALGSKEIREATSYKDANLKYLETTGARRFWSRSLPKNICWGKKKKPIDGQMFPSSEDYKIFNPVQYSTSVRWTEHWSLKASTDQHVFEVGAVHGWKKKLIEYASWKVIPLSKICVVKWIGADDEENTKIRKRVFSQRELEDYTITSIADCKVPASALPQIKQQLNTIRSTSHVGTVFTLKAKDDRSPRERRRKSCNWTRVEKIPTGNKYYVQIDSFRPAINGQFQDSLSHIDACLKTAGLINLDIKPTEVYGIKTKNLEKVTKNPYWIPLESVITKAIRASGLQLEMADNREYLDNASAPSKLYAPKKDLFPTTSIAYQLLTEIDRLMTISEEKEPVMAAINTCFSLLNIESVEPTRKLKPLLEAVAKRYPLLSLARLFPSEEGSTSRWHYNNYYDTDRGLIILPHVADYVTMIENNQEKKP